MHLRTLAASSRPPFLLLTLTSVLLGYAVARLAVDSVDAGMLLLVLAGDWRTGAPLPPLQPLLERLGAEPPVHDERVRHGLGVRVVERLIRTER